MTRPVDRVSTSGGTGDPLPTEAFTNGSVPSTTVRGAVPVVPLPPRDTDDPVLISGRPNRISVGALIKFRPVPCTHCNGDARLGTSGTPNNSSVGALMRANRSCSMVCNGDTLAASAARYDPAPELSACTNC